MTSVRESLTGALEHAMRDDSAVVLLGEDILDPYGGAFGVTRGLSNAFPDQVITTPVSEAGFVGVAGGMALAGLRPIVEIMFGDFVMLAADQLVNVVSKLATMHGAEVEVPLVVRTPMGGRRGYGPTHSQTLEKHLLGVPGLTVVSPTSLGDPGRLLRWSIDCPEPVLFVENKLQYARPVRSGVGPDLDLVASIGDTGPVTWTARVAGAPEPSITIASYGEMADMAADVMVELAFEDEVFAELVVFERLDWASVDGACPLFEAVEATRRLVVAEEGVGTHGWGAEVAADAAGAVPGSLIVRVGAERETIPAARDLEERVLPSRDRLAEVVRKVVIR